MGLDYYIAKELKKLSIDWSTVLQIGRQNWWCTPRETRKLKLAWQHNYSRKLYAEPFFTELGADAVFSVDLVSDENPTYVADLSISWDSGRKFSVVIDGGTGEHIAEQYTYLKNLHDSLYPDGHLISIVPANQCLGHGLYQFSPEYFYRLKGFSPVIVKIITYGFRVTTRNFLEASRWQQRTVGQSYVFAVLRKTGTFALPKQLAVTSSHKKPIPFAQLLLSIPGMRILQRILS